MRKHYLDNIRWVTVVVVVLYHVVYMYNAEGVQGVVGKITDQPVQYQDLFQYIVYPWIMMVLFMVSGVSSRLYLDRHTPKEFIKSRTTKLLVPSTIGLFAFQFIQGYINAGLSEVFAKNPKIPTIGKGIICILSGQGVLWYIQMLWLFSLWLVLIRKAEKDRFWKICGNCNLPVFIALVLAVYGSAQLLNTPKIVVYRFGLYFFVFLLGYFVLSHEETIEILKKWFPLLLGITIVLGTAFCIRYFGHNYADNPVYRSPLFVSYGYFCSLTIIGGMAKYGDVSNAFTKWMVSRSFGLYVFHYLGISSVALFLAKPGYIPPATAYLLSLIMGFAGAYLLYEIISRIPGYRWAVLGIRTKKKEK